MGPDTVLANKYRLVRKLGEGGMGSVWEAVNLFTHRRFALKLVSRGAENLPLLNERMLREASAAGRLQHPNVIEVYDVGATDEGDPFLVMELLEGQTLEQLLKQRTKLQPQQALAVAVEVTRALEAAHAAGIVHRDLKPGNVFLHEESKRGRTVKVLDFGVSKLMTGEVGPATVAGVPIGTPAYMSPEQADGASLDARTDFWSLGVILFEMVAGRLPYDGNNAYAIVGEVLNKEPPRLSQMVPDVDAPLDDVVHRCMQKDPTRRIGTARELLAALEAQLTRSPSAILRGLDEDATHSMEVMQRDRALALLEPAPTETMPLVAVRSAPKPGVVIAISVLASTVLFGAGLVTVLLLRRPHHVEPEIIAVEPTVQPVAQPVPTPVETVAPVPASPEPSASASAGPAPLPVRPRPCPPEKRIFDPKTRRVICAR
jgi:serine/threonine protein kinase